MAYFSAEGHLIEANAAFLALYGYAMGDIKGAHQGLFAAPKSKGERRLAALWRELSVGVAQHGEFDRIDSEGRVFAVLERLEPLKCARTGKTTGVLSTAWPSRQTEEIRAGARRASFESEGAACV